MEFLCDIPIKNKIANLLNFSILGSKFFIIFLNFIKSTTE